MLGCKVSDRGWPSGILKEPRSGACAHLDGVVDDAFTPAAPGCAGPRWEQGLWAQRLWLGCELTERDWAGCILKEPEGQREGQRDGQLYQRQWGRV